MDATVDPLFKRQIDSELKNALKSEERKKTQKRKLSEKNSSEPPKKKEKKSNTIPVSESDIHAIREYFWTQPAYIPSLKKLVLWSGLSNETLAFAAYPILLSAPTRKDKQLILGDYILGVSKPTYVLSGLRQLFATLYPERNAMDYSMWDLYKYNRAYYTVKVEKCSFNQEVLELQMVETKPFGGPKDPSNVHWLEENKLKRWAKAVSLEEFFKDKDPNKILKNIRIPKDAKSWPGTHLNKINEKVEEMKRQLLVSEQEAETKLKKKEIADAIKNLKDDNSDESSDDEDD